MDSEQIFRKGFSMKRNNILAKLLVAGVVSSVSAFAIMTVDKSNGVLTVTSDISGTVIAKVIGPNDEVVVNEKYEGNSFTWSPSGVDGAYRYDVRVVPATQKITSTNTQAINNAQAVAGKTSGAKSDYAGGSIEIRNAQMVSNQTEEG